MKRKKPLTNRKSPAGKKAGRVLKRPALKRGAKAAPHSEGRWAAVFVPRKPGEKRYWLVKSEPDVFSFDDLLQAPRKTTVWDGVRNFAARNFLKDGMKPGDLVFFYHSSALPQAIVGICEVVSEGYPDRTALDPKHDQYDPSSNTEDPTWFAVDLRALRKLARPVTLAEIKTTKALSEMVLLRIGRLSVSPVTAAEWKEIERLEAVQSPVP